MLLVEFLMQRSNAKQILIQVLQSFMTQLPVSLMEMPTVFDKLNIVYRNYLENEIQNQVIVSYIFLSFIYNYYIIFLDVIIWSNIKRIVYLSFADGNAFTE